MTDNCQRNDCPSPEYEQYPYLNANTMKKDKKKNHTAGPGGPPHPQLPLLCGLNPSTGAPTVLASHG